MDFELHLAMRDGSPETVIRFSASTLDEAWAFAATHILDDKIDHVVRMINLSAMWDLALRGSRN